MGSAGRDGRRAWGGRFSSAPTLWMLAAALATGGSLAGLVSWRTRQVRVWAEAALATRLQAISSDRVEQLDASIEEMKRDISFLSRAPLYGELLRDPGAWQGARRSATVAMFESYLLSRPDVGAIGLFGGDIHRSYLRVRRGEGGGPAPSTGDDEHFEAFRRELWSSPPGTLLFSEIEMLPAAAGLRSPQLLAGFVLGRRDRSQGLLIESYDVGKLLPALNRNLPPGFRQLLLNRDGEILAHPDSTVAGAFLSGRAVRWGERYTTPLPRAGTVVPLRLRSGGREWYVFRQDIALDPGHSLMLVTAAPDSAVAFEVGRARADLLSSSLLFLALGGLFFRFYVLRARRRFQSHLERARLGAIVDSSMDAIVGVGADGRILSWNASAERLLGIPASEVLGRPLVELEEACGVRWLERRLAADLERGDVFVQRVERLRPRNAPEFTAGLSATQIRSLDGSHEGWALVARDITHEEESRIRVVSRKDELEVLVAERTERIREYSALQRAILTSAGSAIIATDPEGRVTLFNPAAQALLGWEATEVMGRATPELFHDLDEIRRRGEELSRELGRSVEGFEVFTADLSDTPAMREWTFRHRDGTPVPVLLTVTALRSEEGEVLGYLGIAFDLTERRRIEGDLRLRTDEALAASRAKAAFLAGMSHEIRTPLNAVLGLAGLLERRAGDAPTREVAERIRRAGNWLHALVSDVLDFSKIEAGRLELESIPFRLDDVLEDLAVVMSASAGDPGLEIVLDPAPPGAGLLLGDPRRLGQVLVNLMGNAVKFTERGSVRLDVSLVDRRPGRLRLRFAVRDTGMGIEPETQKHLFQPFVQADGSTSRRFGGTGLGLVISRRLVEGMGGEIELESVPGSGSEFRFEVEFETYGRQDPPFPPECSLSVLAADDSAEAREGLVRVAARLGWDLEAVADGVEVFERTMARFESGDPPRAILLDWDMPAGGGLEVASRLREALGTRVPRLVLLAPVVAREVAEGVDGGLFDAFVSKPVTVGALERALQASSNRGDGSFDGEGAGRLAGLSILAVDDNEINRELLSEICREEGAIIHLAQDGQSALAWLRTPGQRVDVVLMDIQMPGMDGYAATRAVRADEALRDLPVVALSAGVFPNERRAAFEAGMDDFVPKPFQLEELVRALLSVVGRSAVLDVEEEDGMAASLRGGGHRAASQEFLRRFGNARDRLESFLGSSRREDAAVYLRQLAEAASGLGLERLVSATLRAEASLGGGVFRSGSFERALAKSLEQVRRAAEA